MSDLVTVEDLIPDSGPNVVVQPAGQYLPPAAYQLVFLDHPEGNHGPVSVQITSRSTAELLNWRREDEVESEDHISPTGAGDFVSSTPNCPPHSSSFWTVGSAAPQVVTRLAERSSSEHLDSTKQPS